ncbi:MAG: radical SAM protein [Armatimonadetes bacterium]|nr:radical SAM protein [Armatimonadota bacterium]
MEGWCTLGEFNVFKQGPDDFVVMGVDGMRMEVDREAAAVTLAMHGNTRADAARMLKPILGRRALRCIDEMAAEFAELNFIEYKPEPATPSYNYERALANLDEVPRGPLTLQELDVTLGSACPMSCGYCWRDDQKLNLKLDWDDCLHMLDDAQRLACRVLNISGGEPSAFWRLVADTAREAMARGICEVSVNTTGFNLQDRQLQAWREAGIFCINYSFDTLDAERNDDVYQMKGAWRRTVDSIRAAQKYGFLIHLNTTIYGENASELEDMAAFAKSVDNCVLRVNPYVPMGKSQRVSPVVFADVERRMQALRASGHRIYSPLDANERFTNFLVCSAGITRVIVEHDGTVGGCLFLGGRYAARGTVREPGLFRLWTEGDWSFFREEFHEIPSLCQDCRLRFACVGSCYAHALGLTGDAKHRDAEGTFTCPYKIAEKEAELVGA